MYLKPSLVLPLHIVTSSQVHILKIDLELS